MIENHSRKRLDDISNDLSSIPSYDRGNDNNNQSQEEERIFSESRNRDPDGSSYYSSRIDGQSSQTINSDMIQEL